MEGGGLKEYRCAVCGKVFVPAPQHVLKRQYGAGGHTNWFCKPTCMMTWDRYHKRKYTSMK